MKIIQNIIDHTSWNLSQITKNSEGIFQYSKGSVTAYGTAAAKVNPIVGHKYYGRCYQKAPIGFTADDSRFEYYIGDNAGISNLVFGFMTSTKGEWERLSAIQQLTGTPTAGTWFIRSFTVNASNVCYRKEMMIIDLTDAFGAGNEPSLEWCDENLPYIEDKLIIGIFSEYDVGQELLYGYTGAVEEITLYPGKYQLECWGAQGGSYSSYTGGAGGYSTGVLDLLTSTPIQAFIYVGGTTATVYGGFNGGGNGYSSGMGGGGGSDIRLLSDSLYSRVIVAGGGGGAMYANGGRGGGLNGYAGQDSTTEQTGSSRNGGGASQTGGGIAWNQSTWVGKFGEAYHHPGSGYENGGGGGGWYGGAPGYDNDSDNDGKGGGGGSGYVYTAGTASNYPAGCLLNSKYYLEAASTTESTKTGDGEIKITVLETGSDKIVFKPNNNIQEENFIPSDIKVFFDAIIPSEMPTPPDSIRSALTLKKYYPFSTTYSLVTVTKTTSFEFKEWNTVIDGSGTAYLPGDVVIFPENEPLVLYAIWKEAYSYSGFDAGTASCPGYDFLGWSPNSPTDKNNLYTETYIYLTEDTKFLYPVFEERHIRYSANGGTCPPIDSYLSGSNFTVANPGTTMTHPYEILKRAEITLINGLRKEKMYNTTLNTYVFSHWNTQPDGSGTTYNPGATISNPSSSLVLYAIWTKTSTNTPVLLPTPTKTGFGFNGWGTSSTAESGIKGLYNENTSRTFYATWNNQAEKVSYKPKIFQNNIWK